MMGVLGRDRSDTARGASKAAVANTRALDDSRGDPEGENRAMRAMYEVSFDTTGEEIDEEMRRRRTR